MFYTLVRSIIAAKKVIVKVGVLQQDKHAEDEFWVELDPTMEMKIDQNSWLLPFLAWTETSSFTRFHIHKMPGCSSGFMPAGRQSSDKRSAQEHCKDFSEVHDMSTWYFWDKKVDTIDQLSQGASACEIFRIQRASYLTSLFLPSSSVLFWI